MSERGIEMSGVQKLVSGVALSVIVGVLLWFGRAVIDTRDATATGFSDMSGRLDLIELRVAVASEDRYTGRQATADLALRDQRIEALSADLSRLHVECRATR